MKIVNHCNSVHSFCLCTDANMHMCGCAQLCGNTDDDSTSISDVNTSTCHQSTLLFPPFLTLFFHPYIHVSFLLNLTLCRSPCSIIRVESDLHVNYLYRLNLISAWEEFGTPHPRGMTSSPYPHRHMLWLYKQRQSLLVFLLLDSCFFLSCAADGG